MRFAWPGVSSVFCVVRQRNDGDEYSPFFAQNEISNRFTDSHQQKPYISSVCKRLNMKKGAASAVLALMLTAVCCCYSVPSPVRCAICHGQGHGVAGLPIPDVDGMRGVFSMCNRNINININDNKEWAKSQGINNNTKQTWGNGKRNGHALAVWHWHFQTKEYPQPFSYPQHRVWWLWPNTSQPDCLFFHSKAQPNWGEYSRWDIVLYETSNENDDDEGRKRRRRRSAMHIGVDSNGYHTDREERYGWRENGTPGLVRRMKDDFLSFPQSVQTFSVK